MRLPGGQGQVTVELCGYARSFGDLPKSSKKSFKSASREVAWLAQTDTFKNSGFNSKLKGGKGSGDG